MFTHKLKKLPKNTYEIEATVAKDTIIKEYGVAFEEFKKELVVEGFRKGKAPADIAKKRISEQAVYDRVLRSLLPKIYQEIIKKEDLKPTVSPKIELLNPSADKKKDADWIIKITVAGKPIVNLDHYKEIVKKVKDEEKKADIWVPGRPKPPTEEKKDEKNNQQLVNKILSSLINKLRVEISDLIVEEELHQRLAKLVEDIQKVGLSIETYLRTRNKTIDQLKAEYKKEIEDIYKIEFILSEIAESENIVVEDKDLEKVWSNIKDPKELEQVKQNAYFYASVIRKQKTIDYLLSL